MKKLCIHILIILSVMLSACAQATPDVPSGEGVHKTESTQESTVGSDTSGTAVLIEAEEKVEPIIAEALGTKTAADFIGEAVTQKLSANGYTAGILRPELWSVTATASSWARKLIPAMFAGVISSLPQGDRQECM